MFFDHDFRHSGVLDKGPFRRAYVGAAPTFKAIKDAKLFREMSFSGFHVDADLFGRESHRAGLHTPAAMYARPLFS